ncbi:hypothetical protein [Brevibacillus sp. BC25]|uniref:hypothetical protein n=1 Tax=Brevibacillus sp. BC25 TaxID=1144308 RepID=UPI00027137BC|nr:hypothetical protein [Brevibacillus sp. BC25]EJL30015.1 hypothetical protein PMI05_01631 [Brevibacillus sp. BC25]
MISSLNDNQIRQTALMEKMEERAEKQDIQLEKMNAKLDKVNTDIQTIKSDKQSGLSVVLGEFLKTNGKLLVISLIVITASILGLNAKDILTLIQGC